MTLHEIAPLIDLQLEQSLSLFMGKEDMYVKYLKKFPDNVRKLMPGLEEAVAAGDSTGIETAAHSIKGVAANLGLKQVSDPGAALMLDIRENTLDKVAAHYAELAEKVNLAIEYIEKLD
ncbi:MAG: Hpt domain-containing protein [Lachnospiraceae bacterium]|jgi:HPt (histidine-containing phosphotransfer) domain-containing protein|nr:Hpt domain-containing protein [Lachnospiraceae bacterium]